MNNENNANFTPDAPNFKRLVLMSFQGLTNFPYIEEDFDSLTNYGFLSKVVEYLNQVISNNNEQNDLMTALYNAYVSLQDYVNNYFDNLDVQEEINNKLEQMAQDGSLTLLIKSYIDQEIQPQIDEQNETLINYGNAINTHTSQIANLVANASSTEENSELIDIRVANDGITYESAGDSVRKQVNNVNDYIKRDINTLNDGIYTDNINFDPFIFELGGINYNTGENLTSSNIIRTKGYITFNEFDNYFKINYDGTALGDHIYMMVYELDGTYVNYHDIKNSYFSTLSPNKKYRLSIYSNATVSSVSTFLSDFTFEVMEPAPMWALYPRILSPT